jgi:segregation and condensation protein B
VLDQPAATEPTDAEAATTGGDAMDAATAEATDAEAHAAEAASHEAPSQEASGIEAASHEAPSLESFGHEANAHAGTQPENAEATQKAPAHPAKHAAKDKKEKSEKLELRALLKPHLEELIASYESEDRGIEVRQVAGGYRMSTKPEHHDVVRAFSKSLKPPIRLSLQALETLAVIAYKQPITVPEIGDIRGVDTSGVIGTLLERKLITTAGRKAVVGRPMLYKTTKDFLLRFGLKDLSELPSLEEFEKLAAGEMQDELFGRDAAIADATGVPDEAEPESAAHLADGGMEQLADDVTEVPQNVAEPTVSSDPGHSETDEQVAREVASESTGG